MELKRNICCWLFALAAITAGAQTDFYRRLADSAVTTKERKNKMLFLSKTKKAEIKSELLKCIAEQEGEAFNYGNVSKQLNLSFKQLFRFLNELHNEGKIVAHQKCLRKPILITMNDLTNFYWKVYIRSEKYPASKLGPLCR